MSCLVEKNDYNTNILCIEMTPVGSYSLGSHAPVCRGLIFDGRRLRNLTVDHRCGSSMSFIVIDVIRLEQHNGVKSRNVGFRPNPTNQNKIKLNPNTIKNKNKKSLQFDP